MTAIHAERRSRSRQYDRANVHLSCNWLKSRADSQIDPTTGTVKLRADFDNLTTKLFQTSSSMPGSC